MNSLFDFVQHKKSYLMLVLSQSIWLIKTNVTIRLGET